VKKIILYLSLTIYSVVGNVLMAQSDISMSTHWYNRANYNPASIAKPDYLYLFSNVRKQWVGVSGSPTVFNIQASEYFYKMRSAFGISLISDNIGATKAINPMLTYAYRISGNSDWSISMGLSLGIFSRYIDNSLLEADNVNDPYIYSSLDPIIFPDANLGAEFQNAHFIVGVSTTHLLPTTKEYFSISNSNHRYGYVIYKNSDSELFNYNVGLQVVNHSALTVIEGNASIRIKHPTGLSVGPREIFDIGVTYRSTSQFTLLFGLNITPNIRVGYAIDQSFITGYSQNTTHEIMLEFRFPSKSAQTSTSDNWYF